MNTYLFAFVSSAMLSLFLTRAVRDVAIRRGWVDEPDADRKLHEKPIPPVGGLAIALSTMVGIAIAVATPTLVGLRLRLELPQLFSFVGLSLAMMLVGLWDDVAGLTAQRKFALQVLVGSAAWAAGIRIEGWEAAGLHFGMLSLPITLLWIVGITNAFNLIDGIDGLAAGAALFATLALLVVSIVTGQLAVAAMLAAVAGASAGFLRYNFNPASIFLGDSGSLFLGFILSVLSIQSSQKSAVAFAVAVPIVSLGLPVLDTIVVIFRRLIRRQPLFHGDRRHIHHMLLDRGMSPREVVIWLYAICGLLGVLSMLVASPSRVTVGPVLVMLGIAVGIGIQQLKIPELRALNSHVVRSLQRQRRLLAGGALLHSLLDSLAAASEAGQVMCVLSKALEEAGFVSARMTFPRSFEPNARCFPGWAECPVSTSEHAMRTLEWRSRRSTEANAITLVIPLMQVKAFGQLTLVANSDDRHHAAMISWLASDVGSVVGTHLARVCSTASRTLPDANPQSAEC